MPASVRLLEQTWNTAASSNTAGSKSLVAEQQVGRRRPIEAEAAFALRHPATRTPARCAPRPCDVHARYRRRARCNCASRKSPNMSAPEHADEARVAAQPRNGDRDVGRRAAGVLDEMPRRVRRGRRPRQEIDQSLAEAGDRGTPPSVHLHRPLPLRRDRRRLQPSPGSRDPRNAVPGDVGVAQQRQHERVLDADAVGQQRPAAAASSRRRRSP